MAERRATPVDRVVRRKGDGKVRPGPSRKGSEPGVGSRDSDLGAVGRDDGLRSVRRCDHHAGSANGDGVGDFSIGGAEVTRRQGRSQQRLILGRIGAGVRRALTAPDRFGHCVQTHGQVVLWLAGAGRQTVQATGRHGWSDRGILDQGVQTGAKCKCVPGGHKPCHLKMEERRGEGPGAPGIVEQTQFPAPGCESSAVAIWSAAQQRIKGPVGP